MEGFMWLAKEYKLTHQLFEMCGYWKGLGLGLGLGVKQDNKVGFHNWPTLVAITGVTDCTWAVDSCKECPIKYLSCFSSF